MKTRILVVDDDKLKRVTLKTQLEDDGYIVDLGENALVGLEKLKQQSYDAVITDLRMPSMDGITFLKKIKKLSPATEVILMTAYGSIENAVKAMKEGAFEYITKPFSYDELSIKIGRLLEHQKGKIQIETLQKKIQSQYRYHNIIGRSKIMQTVFDKIDVLADSDTTILIEGETGTGKELLANALHYNSHRKNNAFIKISCAILNRDILESELFGHEKGAFTGAIRTKKGRFELADRGTIFLDEIDDIPLDLQVKLLRVIQERVFERVGGERSLEVDVRVVCATKKDLKQMVAEHKFREDLYYRLNVVKIALPPLRERSEDISILSQHFLKKLTEEKKKSITGLNPEVEKIFLSYDWPGNVRELENVVEHAVVLGKSDQVSIDDLPDYFCEIPIQSKIFAVNTNRKNQIDLSEAISEVEKKLIIWALNQTKGNQVKAARLLKIPRTTLRDKLSRIEPPLQISEDDDSLS
ncbi:MAG: sigma-54-dependent Fis family transcriptional regulator [Candidatus Marinimicrobia bacterium]|nr:sigma-54-dependent Fis family transcriptional regulator [Candidatus Neomarinimicrobiota bacterium]